MNEEIKFSLECLKNNVDSGVLDSRYKREIENIEQYIDGLIFCVWNNKYKAKIDKAIEYINKLKNFKIKYVMLEEKELYASEKDFIKDLLDILREDK